MRLKKKNSPNVLFDAAYDLGSLTPAGAVISTAGKAFQKSSKNPAKFDRCVRKVKKSGKGRNAYAICTAAGTRNGRKKNTAKLQRTLQKKAINWRRNGRRNPTDAAAETYEYFHGRPPAEVVDIETPIQYHTVFSGIGKLLALEIFAIDGSRIVRVEHFKGALLCQNEKRTQLYIEGGDQSVNVRDFGITDVHELEILGALTSVVYFTTKDHLDPRDGGTAAYDHKFGGEGRQKKHAFGRNGSRLPLVGYDVRNRLLSIQGGGYDLPAEGIDG